MINSAGPDEPGVHVAVTNALELIPDGARVGLGSGRAGLPLIEPGEDILLDITVDGTDEVAPNLDLVKGWGGALGRERIVAAASKRHVILVGEKRVGQPGEEARKGGGGPGGGSFQGKALEPLQIDGLGQRMEVGEEIEASAAAWHLAASAESRSFT